MTRDEIAVRFTPVIDAVLEGGRKLRIKVDAEAGALAWRPQKASCKTQIWEMPLEMLMRTKSYWLRLEITGMALLILAFGAQAFKDDLSSIVGGGYVYNIDAKLNNIWCVVAHMYSKSLKDNNAPVFICNSDVISRPINSPKSGLEYASSQLSFSKGIQITLYVVGSILVLLGKYRKELAEH